MEFTNPYLAQQLAKERMKDALCEAEQYHLIQVARGPRKARQGWLNSVGVVLIGLVGFVTGFVAGK